MTDAARAPFPIRALSPFTADVVEAAAALLQLDLFITVDSMAAHLAGALGRPVWLLLKRDADWRWMQGRDDSPWYPTMRLFRQQSSGWSDVIENVAAALRRFRERTAPSMR